MKTEDQIDSAALDAFAALDFPGIWETKIEPEEAGMTVEQFINHRIDKLLVKAREDKA